MAARLLLIQLVLFGLLAAGNAMSKEREKSLRSKIRTMIINDPTEEGLAPRNYRMIAGLVRLAFHDCVGKKCDGCINMRNEDNAGLDIYINKTEELYQSLQVKGKKILSRADFWALAGIEALKMASEFAVCRRCKREYLKIKFQTGRKDCTGSPKGSPWTKDVHKFPSPIGTTEDTLKFFKRQFNFGAMDTVAIMGAHTLGQAHPFASGFVNPWVQQKHQFDNEYYKVMMDAGRNWTHVRVGRPRYPKWQWESRTSGPRIMMLNCDMSLLKNLTNVAKSGQVRGCRYSTCNLVNSGVSKTTYWVKAFAKDNSLFLEKFARAFQKMISHGYSNLKDVVSTTSTVVG